MSHVKYCAEEIYYEESSSDSTIDFIKENTHWKDVGVTNDASLHLSVVSQGKFDESVNGKYDENYYYPSSAGEGVDIFIFDSGFDFTHDEFSNTDERTVKCIFKVKDGKLYKISNEKICYNEANKDHGTRVSITAGGRISGAAKKANIYGVLFDKYNMANKAAAMQYIKDNLFGPNKAVFNFSHGGIIDYNPNEIIKYDREFELINVLTEEGAIFFASAGNNSELRYRPCTSENIICVGGVAVNYEYISFLEYTVDEKSNRGKGVDIYAPYSISIFINYDFDNDEINYMIYRGTSFSTPLVAGVVATIISENKNIDFNKEKMLAYLNQIGLHDIIKGLPEGAPNLFINNGNHIVYDSNGNISWDNPVDDQQIEKIINDNEPYVWRKWNGLFPTNVVSTINSDGKILLVGRIAYKNGIHCGYIDTKTRKLTISYGQDVIEFEDGFEILTIPSGHFYWKKITNLTQLNDTEDVIVIGGNENNGNKLGIAKCLYEGKEYYGKVDLNYLKYAYYGLGKKGMESTEYEILIYSKNPITPYQWIRWNGKFPEDAVYINNNPNGKTFVVGRTTDENGVGIYSGYVDVDTKKLTISLNGEEIVIDKDYEILIGPDNHFTWKKMDVNTKFSDNYKIIIGGTDNNGNQLGVVKCVYDKNYYFGHTNMEILKYGSIGIDNTEKQITDFEVLVYSEAPVIPYKWENWYNLPYNAIITDNPNGENYAIGRINYKNGIHCGYIGLIDEKIHISYDGNEMVYKNDFEILTCPPNRMYWKKITDVSQLQDHEHFVIGGNENNGNRLGVAAIRMNNNIYYGKINLEKLDYANFGIDGKEITTNAFEVLIYTDEPFEPLKPIDIIDPSKTTTTTATTKSTEATNITIISTRTTTTGATATVNFKESDEPIDHMEWVKYDGSIPSETVYIKNNPNGETYIIGRTTYNGGIHCGYVNVEFGELTISYGGKQIIVSKDFEILIGPSKNFYWKKMNKNTQLDSKHQVVIGGNEQNGDKLGVARCKYENNYYFGKTNLEYLNFAHIGVENKELQCTEFDILMYDKESTDPSDPSEPTEPTEPVESIDDIEWIKYNGNIPSQAVFIKNNPNGETYIVGRTKYNGGIHCGYVDIDIGELIISYGNDLITISEDFEILIGPTKNFYWKEMNKNTQLDANHQVVVGGNEQNGDKLGVARCKYNNNYYFGKTNLKYLNLANIGVNNREVECPEFEVLIYSNESIEPTDPSEPTEPVESIDHMEWVKYDGNIPSEAVYIKNNPNGETYIVGRTKYNGGIHCGYVDIDIGELIISYGNDLITISKDFEILIGPTKNFYWKEMNKNTQLDANHQVVVGGNEQNGDKLGVARCKYNNNYYFGKTNLKYLNLANIGINNREVECKEFEVLIYSNESIESIDPSEPTEPTEPVESIDHMEWVKYNDNIPSQAVYIKNNSNGYSYVVGRTEYNGGIHCGYVNVDLEILYISYGRKVIKVFDNYEILIGPADRFVWKNINKNFISDDYEIVNGGRESDGDILAVAKCKYNNNYYIGKLNLNEFDHANFAYGNNEYDTKDFEILLYRKN
ncbi:hypothetical protein PIROE2DRAFT_5429 [Piromyces sp. E2]|nr:hypothetical protein PIROE2DRAFT_5429 [Piromyces sp. E2]|eukprot:OUM67164.1 hypothetical protein PIROE2DRAFT_5429 [Piromyces sp. E2]